MLIANRYSPIDETDRGGMGEVLFCEDLHLQRCVVLKYLQPGIESRRLMDEQKALAQLRSKHVVQLYDIVEANFNGLICPAIVLEFISGEALSVASYSANDKYLKIIWQIACGLTDIHSKGIVHRDIKPGNIKVDSEGVVKILDFGLSRNANAAKTQSIIGTPIFMAPELWSDKTITFDSSVDVYAFGVVCLALLNEKAPPGLVSRPPIQPSWAEFSSFCDGIPEDISRKLHECLSPKSADRPRMQEIRELLSRQLLKDKHRATVVLNGVVHTLDSNNRRITLNANVGSMRIEYDGLDFKVESASGAVYVNNSPAITGMVVPGCCVLTFGASGSRKFVTFDVSNPEVMP